MLGGESAVNGRNHSGLNSRRKRRLKAKLLAEQDGVCFWCRQAMLPHESTFDHLVPRSRGGGNAQANLVMAHADCNAGRADVIWPFGKTPPICEGQS